GSGRANTSRSGATGPRSTGSSTSSRPCTRTAQTGSARSSPRNGRACRYRPTTRGDRPMDAIEQLMAPQTEQARERRVHGVLTARVRGVDDDGSYRLEYLSMGGAQPSAPARVMAPAAGARRGLFALPEVGDEVVVAFELGDTNLPVILGGVWNGESPAPSQAKPSPDNNVRTFVSRSGHELTFDDTPGAESVKLKSKSGHTITLDDRPALGKVTVQSKGGRSIVLDDTPPGSASITTVT